MTGLKNVIGIIYSPTGDLGLKGCNINAKQASDVHKGIIRQKRQEKHTMLYIHFIYTLLQVETNLSTFVDIVLYTFLRTAQILLIKLQC